MTPLTTDALAVGTGAHTEAFGIVCFEENTGQPFVTGIIFGADFTILAQDRRTTALGIHTGPTVCTIVIGLAEAGFLTTGKSDTGFSACTGTLTGGKTNACGGTGGQRGAEEGSLTTFAGITGLPDRSGRGGGRWIQQAESVDVIKLKAAAGTDPRSRSCIHGGSLVCGVVHSQKMPELVCERAGQVKLPRFGVE